MKQTIKTIIFKIGAVVYLVEVKSIMDHLEIAREKMRESGLNPDKIKTVILDGGYNTIEHK